MSKLGCIFFVLFATAGLAQESISTELKGKVNADMFNLDGIYVVNLKTESASITDEQGYFSIKAMVGDTLMFSSVQYKALKIALTNEHFDKKLFFVKMVPVMNQLNEVVIKRYNNINARSLGIVPENQKTYTQAERKLKTAGDFKPIMLLGLLGGSMPLDPLINKINGRTKRLKKQLLIEGKAANFKKINYYFADNYYTDKLNIPLEYINEFKLYIIENDAFVTKLKNNDEQTIDFLMIELATKYKEIIACENE